MRPPDAKLLSFITLFNHFEEQIDGVLLLYILYVEKPATIFSFKK